MKEYIGVDFDGTLAYYDHWRGVEHTGKPIKEMVDRVRSWLDDDISVKIFTARASDKKAIKPIEDWCLKYLGRKLEITNIKEQTMVEFWDDRAVRVTRNEGTPCCDGYLDDVD